MTRVSRVGVATSNAGFTRHCVDQSGKPVLRINPRRARLIAFFKQHPPTVVAMEACGGSHHRARKLIGLGHEVRLVPAQGACPRA